MRLEMKHKFDCSEDTFWNKLFFDEEYNRRLFREGLDFALYEPLELKDEGGGSKSRKVRMQPKGDAPAPVRKIIGDPVSVEEGRFDAQSRRWTFKVIPHKMADKISIQGEVRMAPAGSGACERTLTVDINVSIPLVGGIFEGFVEKQMRENYDKGVGFTNRYLKEKGLAGT